MIGAERDEGDVLHQLDKPEGQKVADRGHRAVDHALRHGFERVADADIGRHCAEILGPARERRTATAQPQALDVGRGLHRLGGQQCIDVGRTRPEIDDTELLQLVLAAVAGDHVFGHGRRHGMRLAPGKRQFTGQRHVRQVGREIERQQVADLDELALQRILHLAEPDDFGTQHLSRQLSAGDFRQVFDELAIEVAVGRVGGRSARCDPQFAGIGGGGCKRSQPHHHAD